MGLPSVVYVAYNRESRRTVPLYPAQHIQIPITSQRLHRSPAPRRSRSPSRAQAPGLQSIHVSSHVHGHPHTQIHKICLNLSTSSLRIVQLANVCSTLTSSSRSKSMVIARCQNQNANNRQMTRHVPHLRTRRSDALFVASARHALSCAFPLLALSLVLLYFPLVRR